MISHIVRLFGTLYGFLPYFGLVLFLGPRGKGGGHGLTVSWLNIMSNTSA
jgi:hypothetical protein